MKRILLLYVTLLMVSDSALAQRKISGKVSSEDGSGGIVGVNVVLKGTTTGTITDFDGNYRLSVPEKGGTLTFSFLDLKTQNIEIEERSNVDLVMSKDGEVSGIVVVTDSDPMYRMVGEDVKIKFNERIKYVNKFNTEKGSFEYVNGVRYRTIFDKDLNIDSQYILITSNFSAFGFPVRSAKMTVEKKEGRTRITVTDFSVGEVSSSVSAVSGQSLGGVFYGNSVSDKEKHKMDNKVWDEGKQTFKNSFVNSYSQLLERSILMTIDRIIQDKESDDDW
jgi:hypothetical protein